MNELTSPSQSACHICRKEFTPSDQYVEIQLHISACQSNMLPVDCDRKNAPDDISNTCPMCNKVFSSSASTAEKELHINTCLDQSVCQNDEQLARCLQNQGNYATIDQSKGDTDIYICSFCNKNLTRLHANQRQVHMNKCADQHQKVFYPKTRSKKVKENDDTTNTPECPVCQKRFPKTKLHAHIKRCSAKHRKPMSEVLMKMRDNPSLQGLPTATKTVQNKIKTSAKSTHRKAVTAILPPLEAIKENTGDGRLNNFIEMFNNTDFTATPEMSKTKLTERDSDSSFLKMSIRRKLWNLCSYANESSTYDFRLRNLHPKLFYNTEQVISNQTNASVKLEESFTVTQFDKLNMLMELNETVSPRNGAVIGTQNDGFVSDEKVDMCKIDKFESFCQAKLLEDMMQLLDSSEYSDFTIHCADEVRIPAHKLILMARCPAFKKIRMSNGESNLSLLEFSPLSVSLLLKYLYTGQLPVDLQGDTVTIKDMYSLSEKFEIYELKECLSSLHASVIHACGVKNVEYSREIVDPHEMVSTFWQATQRNEKHMYSDKDVCANEESESENEPEIKNAEQACDSSFSEDDIDMLKEVFQTQVQKNRSLAVIDGCSGSNKDELSDTALVEEARLDTINLDIDSFVGSRNSTENESEEDSSSGRENEAGKSTSKTYRNMNMLQNPTSARTNKEGTHIIKHKNENVKGGLNQDNSLGNITNEIEFPNSPVLTSQKSFLGSKREPPPFNESNINQNVYNCENENASFLNASQNVGVSTKEKSDIKASRITIKESDNLREDGPQIFQQFDECKSLGSSPIMLGEQENLDFSFPPPERSQNTPFPLSCETPNIAKVNTSQKGDLNISEEEDNEVTIMNEIFKDNSYVTNETRQNESFNCSDEAHLFDESFVKDLRSDFVESPSLVNSYKFVEGDPKTRKLQDDTSKLNGSFLTRERIRKDSLSVLDNGSRYSITASENQPAQSKQMENKLNENNDYSSPAISRKRTSLSSSESLLSSFDTNMKSKSPRKPCSKKIKQRSLVNSSSLKQVQVSSDESLSDMETSNNGSFAVFTKSLSSPFLSSSSKRKTNENVFVRSSGKKQTKQRKSKQARKERSREEFKALVKSVAAARCSQDVTSGSNEECHQIRVNLSSVAQGELNTQPQLDITLYKPIISPSSNDDAVQKELNTQPQPESKSYELAISPSHDDKVDPTIGQWSNHCETNSIIGIKTDIDYELLNADLVKSKSNRNNLSLNEHDVAVLNQTSAIIDEPVPYELDDGRYIDDVYMGGCTVFEGNKVSYIHETSHHFDDSERKETDVTSEDCNANEVSLSFSQMNNIRGNQIPAVGSNHESSSNDLQDSQDSCIQEGETSMNGTFSNGKSEKQANFQIESDNAARFSNSNCNQDSLVTRKCLANVSVVNIAYENSFKHLVTPISKTVSNAKSSSRPKASEFPLREESNVPFGPGCSIHPDTKEAITPMPNYDAFPTPELKNQMKKYALRELPKHKMAAKMKEIYKYQHNFKNWEEECTKPPPKKRVKKSKIIAAVECAEQRINDTVDHHIDTKNANSSEELLMNKRGRGKQRKKNNEEDLEVSDTQVEQKSLTKLLMEFIRKNVELHEKVLSYEPLAILSLFAQVKSAEIKCSKRALESFLDHQCICYYNEESQQTRNLGRKRGRPKSKPGNT